MSKFKQWYSQVVAALLLCLAHIQQALAQSPLELEPDGVELESNDPMEVFLQILGWAGFPIVVFIGFVFLILWMKELVKQFGDARDDGKWNKVITTVIGGLVIALIIVYIGQLALSLIT